MAFILKNDKTKIILSKYIYMCTLFVLVIFANFSFAIEPGEAGTIKCDTTNVNDTNSICHGLRGLIGGSSGAIVSIHKDIVPPRREISGPYGIGDSRTKEEIIEVVNRNKPILYSMYREYLKLKPGFSGKVTLKYTIAHSGDILNISILSSTTNYAEFDIAVKNMVSTWKWKPIGVNTTITMPFNFTE